uniref:CSON006857 protein n=1 Tax=Culicoides sonorensis TaxID=179676 RepID=A0A336LZQ1_CULSO
MAQLNHKSEEVLLNIFNVGKKRYKVFFHLNIIKWQKLSRHDTFNEKQNNNDSDKSTTVSLCDILNVTVKEATTRNGLYQIHPTLDIGSPSAIASPSTEFKEFTIHYATETRKRDQLKELKYNAISFCSNDFALVRIWFLTLHDSLRALRLNRPKNLLLFINPYSGKRNALMVYEKYAKPLFQIANVNVTCIISQKANQISDIIIEQDLTRYDGLVIVGGDGTFAEAFNGLIRKYLQYDDFELDDESFSQKINIPIGIIGSGSTDCVAYSIYGTSDPTTSVLNIILGSSSGLDLASVRNDQNTLLKMYCSVLSYGYLGDIIRKSENYRKWLGTKRYEFTGFKEFFKNNGYEVEISYLVDDHSIDNREGCRSDCERCSKIKSHTDNNESHHEHGTWKTKTGKFFMISAANIKCACSKSPNGISPSCHFSDGYIDIICVKHTNLLNNLKLLLTLTKKDKDISDLGFVEKIRTRKFQFRAIASNEMNFNSDYINSSSTQTIQSSSNYFDQKNGLSSFNCDGEILLDSYVTVTGHRNILKVFRKTAITPSI